MEDNRGRDKNKVLFKETWRNSWANLNFMILLLTTSHKLFICFDFFIFLLFVHHKFNITFGVFEERHRGPFWARLPALFASTKKKMKFIIFISAEGDINDVLIKTLAEAHANTNVKLEVVHELFRKPQVGLVTLRSRRDPNGRSFNWLLMFPLTSFRTWPSCFITRTCARRIYGWTAPINWQLWFRTSSSSQSSYPGSCD